jgi:hypothetical protein
LANIQNDKSRKTLQGNEAFYRGFILLCAIKFITELKVVASARVFSGLAASAVAA